MPTYFYHCKSCGHPFEDFHRISSHTPTLPCPKCSEEAVQWFPKGSTAPVFGDYPEYHCPITNKLISGKKAHEANLQRHGCRVLEPGETTDFMKQRAAADKSFGEEIRKTVAEEVAKLPEEKLESLSKELASTELNYNRD